MARPISLLTDYGLVDEFVGVCHGVIARIAPGARVIDVSHGVPPQDVTRGALMLRAALPYLPAGVHVAVVDPGVGGARRAVAARCAAEERVLVGPDNGVLSLAAADLGGAVEAVEISRSPARLEPVSPTFHGRDVFAPVAARLALGAPLAALGDPLDPAGLCALELPSARVERGALVTAVVAADGFGNLQLAATASDLAPLALADGADVELAVGDARAHARRATTFEDVARGELLLYEDAAGLLALAVSHGSAALRLAARPGDRVRIAPGRPAVDGRREGGGVPGGSVSGR